MNNVTVERYENVTTVSREKAAPAPNNWLKLTLTTLESGEIRIDKVLQE